MKHNFIFILFVALCIGLLSNLANTQQLYAQSVKFGAGLTLDDDAQNGDLSTGLIFDDNAYGEMPRLNYQMQFTSKKKPRNYLNCPTPVHQGLMGSCVGHAFSTALTIMRAEKRGITDPTQMDEMRHSPLYIYNQIKVSENCEAGSYMTDALTLLQQKGDCLLQDFAPNDCHPQPTSREDRLAAKYRIKDAGTLFSLKAAPETKVETTLGALSEGYPVVIGMRITPSFIQLKKEQWRPVKDEPTGGGHAMVVVGYDNMRKVFRIMNSWGKKWGKEGFFTIGFDDYAKYVKYGYQILLEKRTDPNITPIELKGTFEFLQYDYYDENNEKYIFTKRNPNLNGLYYTLEGIEKDTWFRIKAKNMTKGSYVYVFSLKPNQEVEILYPSDKSLVFSQSNEYIDGIKNGKIPKKQKPVVVSEDVELMIPQIVEGSEGLTTDIAGTDYLCILYSDQEIKDIQELVKKVQQTDSEDFAERLQTAFGDRLMPTTDIRYIPLGMGIKASSRKGYIAPIVLKVEVK